jgi:hypothetical protein
MCINTFNFSLISVVYSPLLRSLLMNICNYAAERDALMWQSLKPICVVHSGFKARHSYSFVYGNTDTLSKSNHAPSLSRLLSVYLRWSQSHVCCKCYSKWNWQQNLDKASCQIYLLQVVPATGSDHKSNLAEVKIFLFATKFELVRGLGAGANAPI